MGKIIASIIVIALAVGVWYIFSQASDTAAPTSEKVTEPINDTRDLENRATTPRIDQTIE